MAIKLADHVESYRALADAFLAKHNLEREQIATGRDAWSVASAAGITRHAYDLSRDITDGHIQSALERVFPKAVFRDRKIY